MLSVRVTSHNIFQAVKTEILAVIEGWPDIISSPRYFYSLLLYKNNNIWSDFNNIIQPVVFMSKDKNFPIYVSKPYFFIGFYLQLQYLLMHFNQHFKFAIKLH